MNAETEETLPDDEVRTSSEIAIRALTLFAVVRVALGAPKAETVAWLHREALWQELSPRELSFLSQEEPSQRERVNATWRSEALLVLLWSLGKVDQLPSSNEQCNPNEFRAVLPPFSHTTVKEFVETALPRSAGELMDMANSLLNDHWEARDARINGRPSPACVDIGIVQERHHAINWLIGYDGSPWDEVMTDT